MVSFSTLIFGSIPESYGLTAPAIAMAFLMAARPRQRLTLRRSSLWVALGVYATGITVINIILVAIVLSATVLSATDRVAAAMRVSVIVLASFALTIASSYVLDRLLVPPEASGTRHLAPNATILDRAAQPFQKELTRHLEPDRARRLSRFPTSVANAFAPPALERVRVKTLGRHQRGYTLEQTPNILALRDPFGLSLLVLVIVGGLCALAAPRTRTLALASIGLFGFSWVLSVWGSETFLYSQNWQLGAVLLAAGVMRARRQLALTAALAVLTFLVAANNLLLLREIVAVLAAS
jgi:hypothetical protein